MQIEAKKFIKGKLSGVLDIPSTTLDGSSVWTSPVKWGRGLSVVGIGKFTVDHRVGLAYLLGRYEPEVIESMGNFILRGDSVIDAGAHVGYLSVYMSKLVGREGTVYSFEPTPRNREIMNRNILENNANNVRVLPYALSNTTGDVDFILDPSSYENRIAGGILNGHPVIRVPTITIDAFVQNNSIHPAFIKMDIEGAELDALCGSRHTLAKYHPVVVAEVRDVYWSAIRNLMEGFHYKYQVLSKLGSNHCQRGTPNVLFTPN